MEVTLLGSGDPIVLRDPDPQAGVCRNCMIGAACTFDRTKRRHLDFERGFGVGGQDCKSREMVAWTPSPHCCRGQQRLPWNPQEQLRLGTNFWTHQLLETTIRSRSREMVVWTMWTPSWHCCPADGFQVGPINSGWIRVYLKRPSDPDPERW